METFKIGIIASSSFPLPPSIEYTGDIVIVDLARTLDEMGHEVDLYAPEGSYKPPHGRTLSMPCSWNQEPSKHGEHEQTCFDAHCNTIWKEDIIHDFSVTKRIAENLFNDGWRNVISTLLGGRWDHPKPPINIIVWSKAMRQRGLRGATDYENTPTPDMGGLPSQPIRDAHVVYGGIDTDYYSPSQDKEEFFLWMNRWHPAKGYHVAIDLARKTGIQLVMAGDHPNAEKSKYQQECALDAQRRAAGLPNIRFEWLPQKPAYTHHLAKRNLYCRAKALLYTVQFQEPFGLGQVEALSCGTPVIGTNFGSVPEVIEHGKTGYVCDTMEDLRVACDAIDLINPKMCRGEAVRRFDRHVMAKNYEAEYKAVLDGDMWGTWTCKKISREVREVKKNMMFETLLIRIGVKKPWHMYNEELLVYLARFLKKKLRERPCTMVELGEDAFYLFPSPNDVREAVYLLIQVWNRKGGVKMGSGGRIWWERNVDVNLQELAKLSSGKRKYVLENLQVPGHIEPIEEILKDV